MEEHEYGKHRARRGQRGEGVTFTSLAQPCAGVNTTGLPDGPERGVSGSGDGLSGGVGREPGPGPRGRRGEERTPPGEGRAGEDMAGHTTISRSNRAQHSRVTILSLVCLTALTSHRIDHREHVSAAHTAVCTGSWGPAFSTGLEMRGILALTRFAVTTTAQHTL